MVTTWQVSPVTPPDRATPLPGHLPPGTRVRLGAGSREVGAVLKGEQDRGDAYAVVHVDWTGALRCIRPDTLIPLRQCQRAQS